MNNADFVEGLRNHDPEAAKHLRDCFVPTVWRFVYVRVSGDRHLAEDITSEAVLAFVAAIGQGIDIQSPSAWLRCVAQRKLQDHFRAVARVQHLMQQAGANNTGQTVETPVTQHDRKLLREEVRWAIDRLPETQQLALQWKYVDRLSVREIAQRLSVTEKSAEAMLFRARNNLRAALGKESRPDSAPANSDPTPGRDDEDDDPQPAHPSEMTQSRS